MKRTIAIGLAVWLSSLTISPVNAQALPNASTAAGYQYYRSDWNGASLYDNVYGDGSKALTSQNLQSPSVGIPYIYSVANPFGVVSAYSAITGATDWFADGYSQIGYYVAVAGIPQDTIVPIMYTARLRAEITGPNALADAGLYISSSFGTEQYRSAKCSTSCVGDYPDLDISGVVDTRGSLPIFVQLSAHTEVYNFGTGTATALSDPFFYIDPTYLSANPGLTLQFSPSVGNDAPTPAVSEPATWAMVISGFGLVGGALRRRTFRPAGVLA